MPLAGSRGLHWHTGPRRPVTASGRTLPTSLSPAPATDSKHSSQRPTCWCQKGCCDFASEGAEAAAPAPPADGRHDMEKRDVERADRHAEQTAATRLTRRGRCCSGWVVGGVRIRTSCTSRHEPRSKHRITCGGRLAMASRNRTGMLLAPVACDLTCGFKGPRGVSSQQAASQQHEGHRREPCR